MQALATWLVAAVLLFTVGAKAFERPKGAQPHLRRAEKLSHAGRLKEALAEYRKAYKLPPRELEAHQALQDLVAEEGGRRKLLSRYRAWLEKHPKSADANFLYGRLLLDLKEKERLYKKAVELEAGHFWAHYGLGYLYERQQKWKESEEHFKKAIEIRPDSPEAYHGLGFCYMNQGRDKEAAEQYHAALKIKPDYVESILNLSLIAMRRRHYNAAIRRCKRVLALDKGNPWAYNNLGKAYCRRGKLDEALAAFKAALSSPRYDTREIAYLNMGFVYRRKEDYDMAAGAYGQAIKAEPNFAYAYNCLAQVQYHQKKFAHAWENVRKAEKLGYRVNAAFLKVLREAHPAGEKRAKK